MLDNTGAAPPQGIHSAFTNVRRLKGKYLPDSHLKVKIVQLQTSVAPSRVSVQLPAISGVALRNFLSRRELALRAVRMLRAYTQDG